MKTFEAPGPGCWMLDAAHCERAHSRFVGETIAEDYIRGMRAGMERYGVLLDTIEMKLVNGFVYTCPRPLGAPPDAKGPPPKFVFKLLTWLHPALRKRIARAEVVVESRLWREDARAFMEEHAPRMRERLTSLQAVDPSSLADEELIEHVRELAAASSDDVFEHFRMAPACMVPVGEYLTIARALTSCTLSEAISPLTGYSPYSVDGVAMIDRVARCIAEAPDRESLMSGEPGMVLARLRTAPGELGRVTEEWLALVGERIVTGHDVAEQRAIELPQMLLDTLRSRLEPSATDVLAESERMRERLRAKVPVEEQARFDAALDEARVAYPLRDARNLFVFWAFGLTRRALLEAGARLMKAGRLNHPEHAVDLTLGELTDLLLRGKGPTPAEVEGWVNHRLSASCADMPDNLGLPPSPPPPADWLPPHAARVARALDAYIELSFKEAARSEQSRGLAKQAVTGVPASPGRYVGRARLVRSPSDFGRVERGDVLIARITTTSYNALLPLVGAIVTERGGLLSHPAIVSREFGIPGIVGARGALDLIREGARIEVDGTAGIVTVLS